MADNKNRLASIDQLIEDFELIVIEKAAIAAWADGKLARLNELYVLPVEKNIARAVKRGLLEMKHDSLLDAETYAEYTDGLLIRREELLSGGVL